MKKLAMVLTLIVTVSSFACSSLAYSNSMSHSYGNHREKASVSVETKPIGGEWFAGVELWNATGRFADYDDISTGTFYTVSACSHSVDTGSFSAATRGFYCVRATEMDGSVISGTVGSGYDS